MAAASPADHRRDAARRRRHGGPVPLARPRLAPRQPRLLQGSGLVRGLGARAGAARARRLHGVQRAAAVRRTPAARNARRVLDARHQVVGHRQRVALDRRRAHRVETARAAGRLDCGRRAQRRLPVRPRRRRSRPRRLQQLHRLRRAPSLGLLPADEQERGARVLHVRLRRGQAPGLPHRRRRRGAVDRRAGPAPLGRSPLPRRLPGLKEHCA
mmetsp:Transcript_21414/g.85177  ORF Transcript_21414/g.85177 Transcript_21414/m.85177 type:complete len:213 (-) Transcript_21414:271-909(-)